MSPRLLKQAIWTGGLAVAVLAAFALLASRQAPAKPPRETGTKSARNTDDKPPQDREGSDAEGAATDPADLEKATFGAGCFWCSEAVFQQLKGVRSVASGYSGGVAKNPTYELVCTGATGHAEVIQVTFDPKVISYDELLEVFWQTHDPTTLNQQGADIGTQYRSVIFYHAADQKKLAEHYKKQLEAEHAFRKPIVTEISKFTEFYPAEAYHQNYYNLHRGEGYCSAIIRPKVAKVKKVFKDKLNEQATKPRSR
jgi:peptide-methionine (S)-S-oxide reductase